MSKRAVASALSPFAHGCIILTYLEAHGIAVNCCASADYRKPAANFNGEVQREAALVCSGKGKVTINRKRKGKTRRWNRGFASPVTGSYQAVIDVA